MLRRSFDLKLLLRLTKNTPGIGSTGEDFESWFNTPMNMMFSDGENVGLATYERPGIYTVHWYYTKRGREAINLAKDMIKNLFDNYECKLVTGFVKKDMKASRWATRQVGLKSQGFVTFSDGDVNEMFTATKDEFLKGYDNG